jgi:hypothetical protein
MPSLPVVVSVAVPVVVWLGFDCGVLIVPVVGVVGVVAVDGVDDVAGSVACGCATDAAAVSSAVVAINGK